MTTVGWTWTLWRLKPRKTLYFFWVLEVVLVISRHGDLCTCPEEGKNLTVGISHYCGLTRGWGEGPTCPQRNSGCLSVETITILYQKYFRTLESSPKTVKREYSSVSKSQLIKKNWKQEIFHKSPLWVPYYPLKQQGFRVATLNGHWLEKGSMKCYLLM